MMTTTCPLAGWPHDFDLEAAVAHMRAGGCPACARGFALLASQLVDPDDPDDAPGLADDDDEDGG